MKGKCDLGKHIGLLETITVECYTYNKTKVKTLNVCVSCADYLRTDSGKRKFGSSFKIIEDKLERRG